MKLNPDCVRDTLIWLEDNIQVNSDTSFTAIYLKDLYDGLDNYSEEDIYYTIYNLFQIKYIEGRFSLLPSGAVQLCEIRNITWYGHEFLNTVRPKKVWDATKTGALKLGIMSISTLSMLAKEITKAIVTRPELIQTIVAGLKF